MRTKFLLPGVCAAVLLSTSAIAADWPQFGYDAAHSGNNPDEETISAANVAQLVPLYATAVTLPAAVDSAPVYQSAVVTPDGTKDLLFLLSKNGKVMAIDAADGSVEWSHQTNGTQPATASPAVDPNLQFVYSYGIDGNAHKYQIGDGTEITTNGWPQTITLKPSVEKGASGFTIAHSGGTHYLVVVTDGYIGDGGDYQGHLTSINLDSGTQNTFNVMCSDKTIHFVLNGTAGVDDCANVQSGIWGRGGATFDEATGRVFIATGNGHYNASSGGFNWGDSVLALAVDGTGSGGGLPLDSYTPTNFQQLDNQDADLGSISLAVLPTPAGSAVAHLGMQVGKDHTMRLIDLADMSGAGAPAHVGGELQLFNVPQGGSGMREQPAVWVDGSGTTWVFVANNSGLSGVKLGLDAGNQPVLSTGWNKTGMANSPIVANGVLYYAGACSGGTCVIARDPLSGDVLWTSPHIGSLHWQSPILVNGAIYMTDNSSKLWKFGLSGIPNHTVTPGAGAGGSIAPGTPQSVVDGQTTSFTVAADAHYRIDAVTGCGGSLSGDLYTTGPITADCAVDASFALITHTVTPLLATAGGSIAPATPQTVNDGDTISFSLSADPSFAIDTVSGCGGALAGAIYTTAAITLDCTVSAAFAKDTSDVIFRNGFEVASP
ncbi:MAG TPA: PQQ-binding-like beta-propeller repeat protein [Dokdonella sp.]